MAKSTDCSSIGFVFDSLHSHGGSQPPVDVVSGGLMPPPGLLGYQVLMWDQDMHSGKNNYTHDIKSDNYTF